MSSCIKPSTRSLAVSTLPLTSKSAISLRDFLASASRFSCKVRNRCIDSRIWTCVDISRVIVHDQSCCLTLVLAAFQGTMVAADLSVWISGGGVGVSSGVKGDG